MSQEPTQGQRLGVVVSGSMSRGLEVRLDSLAAVEDMAVGRYVTIQGQRQRFFGMVTDVSLQAADPRLVSTPPDLSDSFLAEVVSGTAIYGTIHVVPMLAVGDAFSLLEGPQPAKTIPSHFAEVRVATQRDIELVFGQEDERHFWVGSPLDMETRVCLNLAEFVKRSNGVFGKSGTGKTFLTRLLLVGILQKSAAVNLVFDMQSEYGWQGYREGGGWVKGLKQLFPSQVAVFSLDEEHCRRRGVSTDFVVRIGYDEIEPDDIQVLRESLGLSEVAADAAYSLQRQLGKHWLRDFLQSPADGLGEMARSLNVNDRALSTLKNRLGRLQRFQFVDEHGSHDLVDRLLGYLDQGLHVVLEFGRYKDDTAAYVLVANLLTRRLHQHYVERKERAMGDRAQEPPPLVITIEEAHRFLNPQVASQTIFGTIAREMRKYNVSLLVIDQRPSGIDEEVMSQLGTKIACLLDNERDIDSVLTGVPGKAELKGVLARLESKQQALIFGHALPMPVVVRTREYGSAESYKDFGFPEAAELKRRAEKDAQELFGEDG